MTWILNFDGGCTPNPGKGSCAYKAVCRDNGYTISRAWAMGPEWSTNNQAEWEAMIVGLEELMEKAESVRKIIVYGDSQLVINQANGLDRVKSTKLRPYYRRLMKLRRENSKVEFIFSHIYREINTEMDEACKNAR